jgi:hypothetical protein
MPPAGIDKCSDYFECVSWIPWRRCCNMRQATRTKLAPRRLDDEQMDDAWAGGEVARQTRRLQAAAERAGSARVGQRTHQTDNRPLIHVSTALCHMSNHHAGQWSMVSGRCHGWSLSWPLSWELSLSHSWPPSWPPSHVHPSPCRDDNNGGDIR